MNHLINNFFNARPALSKSGVSREAGISLRLLDYILKGEKRLTKRTANKLFPVLNKYGGCFEVTE